MPKRRTTVLSRQIIRSDGFGLEGGLVGPTGPAGPATTDASLLSSGTLPNGRFPATLPAASGVNLTALNASNLGSGTVPDARFPAVLPAVSGVNLTGLLETQIADGALLARLAAAETVAGLWDFTNGIKERGRTAKLGEWTSYTPVWSTTGVAPAIGNGVLGGRYMRVGRTTFFQVVVGFGTTTTFGTGAFTFTLPETADLSTSTKFFGELTDASAGQVYFGIGQFFTSTVITVYDGTTRTPITGTSPFVWANTDAVIMNGFYEAL